MDTARGVECRHCRKKFPSDQALQAHITKEFDEGNGHLHCYICRLHFRTEGGLERHIHESHANKQDLNCPGCDQKFTRIGRLMEHIEIGTCKVIDNERLAEHREKKLAFARELQLRHRGEYPDTGPDTNAATNSNHNFSHFLGAEGSTRGPSFHALRPKAEATVRPNPIQFQTRTIDYHHGYSKQADLLTGPESKSPEQQSGGQWGHQDNLSAGGPAVVQPTPEHRQVGINPEETKENAFDFHDPKAPGFNPRRYYVTYIQKYKCPHVRCGKSFPTLAGFTMHMNSASHSHIRFQCPSCLRWFNSMTAITQHCESQGIRCDIRHSDKFRAFLDQLTAGICDVDGVYDTDGTTRYVVPKEAMEHFAPREKLQKLKEQAAAASQQKIAEELEKKKKYWEENKPEW